MRRRSLRTTPHEADTRRFPNGMAWSHQHKVEKSLKQWSTNDLPSAANWENTGIYMSMDHFVKYGVVQGHINTGIFPVDNRVDLNREPLAQAPRPPRAHPGSGRSSKRMFSCSFAPPCTATWPQMAMPPLVDQGYRRCRHLCAHSGTPLQAVVVYRK